MLKGIKQSDKELLPVINDYGCLFLCFAQSSPLIFEGKEGRQALNKIWTEATKKGYISDDLNHDGDYDDDGEAEIKNHNALANEFFALDVRYDGVHHKADEKIPSNFSISLWINPSNNTTNKREIIIGKLNSILLFNGANNDNNLIMYFYSNSQSNRYLLRQGLLTPNVWHFVVITKNGTQLKCYINGVLVNTLTCVESIDQNSNSFNIGFSTNERSNTKDDFQIFNRALSDTEVQALYLNKANTPKYYSWADWKLSQV